MILTVTLNPALELSCRVPHLDLHGVHRVPEMTERPAGRGVGAARLLAALGHPTTVTGFAGGRNGTTLRELLVQQDGVTDAFVTTGGSTRRTLAVVDGTGGAATRFDELGPHITPTEWAAFRDTFATLLTDPDTEAVALCGSLPPGVPVGAYAQLVRDARDAGKTVLLDTAGEPLRRGLAARPDIVSADLQELAAITGSTEPLRAARGAQRRGAHAIAVSLGADGVLVVAPEGLWYAASPPRRAEGPADGGCPAAGLLSGLTDGIGWPERLTRAVALSAAAPAAGAFDERLYQELLRDVHVTEQSSTG